MSHIIKEVLFDKSNNIIAAIESFIY